MPQLDSVSFLAQFIWVVVGLGFLYLFLMTKALPALQRQLGARGDLNFPRLVSARRIVVCPFDLFD